MPSLPSLRKQLITHSLFPPTTLPTAIKRLGFIQADPIRSPARSQDLILRHRVKNYKAGDLEKKYSKLDLEEDFTFAYGFLPRSNRDLLYPRPNHEFTKFDDFVIEQVSKLAPAHPSAIAEACGNESVRNYWGGRSKRTKRSLELAHHFGRLRVCHREKGIRIYEPAPKINQVLEPEERFRQLILLTSNLFGPTNERFLLKELSEYKYLIPNPSGRRKEIDHLVESKKLKRVSIDDINYIYPSTLRSRKGQNESARFLAPFDPIVRDRERFEHLWSWTYRFEAYTPAAKRVRGYYALPILWREDIIGWCNANVIDSKLHLEIGYEREPKDKSAFQAALEKECSAFAAFLHLDREAWLIKSTK